jgi:hypothetical protein
MAMLSIATSTYKAVDDQGEFIMIMISIFKIGQGVAIGAR